MSIQTIRKVTGIRYRVELNRLGHRMTKVFRRRADAEQWERRQLLRQDDMPPEQQVKQLRFHDYAKEWFDRYARVRKSLGAQVRDELDIRLRLDPAFGKMYLREINTGHVDDFVALLVKAGKLSKKTINLTLGLLKKMLSDAVRWRYLDVNPAARIELVKVNPQTIAYWEKDEIERFLTAAKDDELFPFYLTALNTGMRLGEIAALKWDRVNLETGVITVSRTYCMVSHSIKETTKGNKIRQIPINQPLLAALRKLKLRSIADLVFSGADGKVIDINHLSAKSFKRMCRKAGVPVIRFHDTRHTFASHFVMNGGDLFQLKELLGHTDIKTTLRYSHMSPKHLLNTARVVLP